MKIFLDTADIDQIRKYSFLIDGVTTTSSETSTRTRIETQCQALDFYNRKASSETFTRTRIEI